MSQNIDPNLKPDPFSDASEVWKFLAGVTDYEKMSRFGKGRVAWNLDSMRRILDYLGRPDRNLTLVHIGGTKGKGSTARLVEAALRTGGAATGLYTSPHIDFPLERIELDGSSLPESTFVRLMNRLHPVLVDRDGKSGTGSAPTFFEIFTTLALSAFEEAEVDVAILEVGLGGRLDATNAVDRTSVSVITSVSRDHTHLLGDTVETIAADKAGILRPRVPAITGVRPGEAALPPIEEAAEKVGAPLKIRGRHFDILRFRPTPGGGRLDVRLEDRILENLEIGCLGPFQARNAAVALATLQALEEVGGPHVNESALRDAWRHFRVPGRMEVLNRDPPVVVDGAHNRASALALLAGLSSHFPGAPIILVLGMAGDKLVEETAAPLLQSAAKIHCTRTGSPRSLDPAVLRDLAARLGREAVSHPSVPEAMDAARADQGSQEVVVAAGSLYLAGEVRAWAERDKSRS